MAVYINERLAMRLTCTPQHLDELILGRLLTEGLILRAEDVQQIYICEKGLRAKVTLLADASGRLTETGIETVNTCCTDNRTYLSDSAESIPMVTPLPWESAWLQGMAEKTRGGQSLYESTHAVHACCLFREGRLLCCREDIGRHNALDKVIGWALITGTWRRGAGGDPNWKGMSPDMRHPAARGHLHHAASGDICPRSGRRANQRGRYYYGRRKRRSTENGEFPPAPLPRKPSWKSSDNLLFYEVLYSYEPDLPPFSEGGWGGSFFGQQREVPPVT